MPKPFGLSAARIAGTKKNVLCGSTSWTAATPLSGAVSEKGNSMSEMDKTFEDLANAIVAQAAKDYGMVMDSTTPQGQTKKKELLEFFYSEWFGTLSKVDPDYILARVERNELLKGTHFLKGKRKNEGK